VAADKLWLFSDEPPARLEQDCMNLLKLLAPDTLTGKVLVWGKSLVDIAQMLISTPSARSMHFARTLLLIKPRYTMVTNRNLINLYALIETIEANQAPGDIVECGVWNGGSAAMMGLALSKSQQNIRRSIWLFDSFSGLPKPGNKDGSIEQEYYFEGLNRGNLGHVEHVFRKLLVSMHNVRIVRGWFDETLPSAHIDQIALLHIDADWYESVKLVLETFYDSVVPGGFIVLDDYGYWEGCKRAIDEFCIERDIDIIIKQADRVGAYFQKPYVHQIS
jgi:O-methyltransferase